MSFKRYLFGSLLALVGCGFKAPPSYRETEKIVPWQEQFLHAKKATRGQRKPPPPASETSGRSQ